MYPFIHSSPLTNLFLLNLCSLSAYHCGDCSSRRRASADPRHCTDCHLLPVSDGVHTLILFLCMCYARANFYSSGMFGVVYSIKW